MFYPFILIINLQLLIPTVNRQIFNPIIEPAIPKETATNEANTEVEADLLIVEKKTRKGSN